MKLFNKIAIASIGAAMAIGAGIVGSKMTAKVADAAGTGTFTEYTGAIKEGDYVIYYGGYAMKAAKNGTASRLDGTTITPSAGVITDPDASLVWHIAASGDYWTLYNAGADSYACGNGTKNQAVLNAEAGDGAKWTITMSDGKFEMVNYLNDTKSVNKNLRGNTTYGFACYATSTGGPLSLYRSSAGDDPSVLTGVSVAETFSIVKLGTTLNLQPTATPSTATSVTIAATSDNTNVATVTNAGVVTPVAAGIANITVSATQGSNTFTKEVKVIVASTSGSSEAEALSPLDTKNVCLATGTSATASKYYIKGTVKSVTISSGSTANLVITDGTNDIEYYKMYDVNGANFSNTSKIKIGDTVVFYSVVLNYNGTKAEAQYGSLISVTSNVAIDSVEIRGDVTIGVSVGDDFNISELSVYAIYSDATEVDVTDMATIACNPTTATVVGTATITVSASYNSVNAISRTFNVTVTPAVVTVTDTITSNDLVATSTSYTKFEDVMLTSKAVYGGCTAKDKDTSAIQMNNSKGGIMVTKTGGKRVKSVTITVAKGNKRVSVYGSNVAYVGGTNGAEGAIDTATRGTLIDSTTETATISIPNGTDYKYVAIISPDGASYLASVAIEWEVYSAAEIANEISNMAGGWNNHVATANCASNYASAKGMILTLSDAEMATFKTSTDSDIVSARETYAVWCARNGDETPYEGEIVSASRNMKLVNTDTTTVVIVISVISVSALAAFLMLKKKKNLVK